jgi:predicted DNA-binding WGR domain protein
LFRSWGRVGTTIGGNKLTDYTKKQDALNEFFIVYKDKTGNEWDDRKTSVKNPGKFYPLEMDYGDEVKK